MDEALFVTSAKSADVNDGFQSDARILVESLQSVEGIIDDDVDRSIRNLTSIGAEAMNRTDEMVLDIMTHKGC